MARLLWCWRCREQVMVLEAHEWRIIEQARDAGPAYSVIYEGARSAADGRAVPTCHTRYYPDGDYLRAGFELFTGIPESEAGLVDASFQAIICD